MHPLISKLLHWFLYGGTLFFAAGAVAEPAAPAAAAPAAPASSPDPAPAAAPAAEPAAPATPAAPSLTDIVNKAAADAEKSLTKTAEPPAAAQPVADPAKPAADPAKPAAEVQPAAAEPNPLDKLGPLPAEKITAALADAPPAVQEFSEGERLVGRDTQRERAPRRPDQSIP